MEGTSTWEAVEIESSSTTGSGVTLVAADISGLQWSMIANASTGGAGANNNVLISVGTGVSWRPSGVQTKRAIWVSKSGSDSNSGLLEGDAKATIGAAATIAVETATIKVRPGV